jgi:TFIIF-interacting CTD phosphatase-like protein
MLALALAWSCVSYTLQIHSGRKLLVLDLDETLVHSSFKPVSHSDYVLDIMVDSTSYKVHERASMRACVIQYCTACMLS